MYLSYSLNATLMPEATCSEADLSPQRAAKIGRKVPGSVQSAEDGGAVHHSWWRREGGKVCYQTHESIF